MGHWRVGCRRRNWTRCLGRNTDPEDAPGGRADPSLRQAQPRAEAPRPESTHYTVPIGFDTGPVRSTSELKYRTGPNRLRGAPTGGRHRGAMSLRVRLALDPRDETAIGTSSRIPGACGVDASSPSAGSPAMCVQRRPRRRSSKRSVHAPTDSYSAHLSWTGSRGRSNIRRSQTSQSGRKGWAYSKTAEK